MVSRVRIRGAVSALHLGSHRRRTAALLSAVGVLYLWNPGVSGWGNDYYAAAVQSGSQNATAFFFGSLDPENFISIDKPPLALWVMGLSARVWGFQPWALLLPEAVAGVVAVGVMVAAVRRVAGSGAGLVAGLVLALTPSVVLVSRYNNPDAILLLLTVATAYLTIRAVEDGRTRWAIGAGVVLGLAFLTKSLQAFLVAPGLVAAYTYAGPGSPGARLRQIVVTAAATASTAACWLVTVTAWPPDERPYLGGSSDNSALQQAFGFDGVDRLIGSSTGGADSGPLRLFGHSVGGQIAWLLPAALGVLIVGMWWTRAAERTNLVRASLVLWGGWLLVTGAVLNGMHGIFHSYYTSELGPAIAALVGIGTHLLWRHRDIVAMRAIVVIGLAGTATWAFVLLARTSAFLPWLRWIVLAAGLGAAAEVMWRWSELTRRGSTAYVAILAALVLVGAPAAYSVVTVATPHHGSGPKAGPNVSVSASSMPSPELVAALSGSGTTWTAAVVGGRSAADLELAGVGPVMAIGGYAGADPVPALGRFQQLVAAGRVHWFVGSGGTRGVGKQIAGWVRKRFPAHRVGGVVVYDLTRRVDAR